MRTPHLDLALLDDPARLSGIIVPGRHRIQCSRSVAELYGFPEGRTEEGFTIMLDAEQAGGDFLEAREGEPVLLLEDYASFCTLLCAVDERGNAATFHGMLLASRDYLGDYAMRNIRRFREEVDGVLRGTERTLVVAGTSERTGDIPRLLAELRGAFADAAHVVTQLSRNPLGGNALPALTEGEGYSGMLYVPEMLSATARRTLLVLHNGCRSHELLAELRRE